MTRLIDDAIEYVRRMTAGRGPEVQFPIQVDHARELVEVIERLRTQFIADETPLGYTDEEAQEMLADIETHR